MPEVPFGGGDVDGTDISPSSVDTQSVDTDESTTKTVPVIDPTHPDFGAVGDGAADDTTALQNAADAVSGGTMRVPSGTYLISSPITFGANNNAVRRIEGVGENTVTIRADSGVAQFGSLLTCPSGEERIKISGITFDGNSNVDSCVNLGDSNSSLQTAEIESSYFQNAVNDGLRLQDPIVSEVRKCRASQNGRHGFNTFNGTSTSFIATYGLNNGVDNYNITKLSYSSFINTASDRAGDRGYFLGGCKGCTLIAPGVEKATNESILVGDVTGLKSKGVGIVGMDTFDVSEDAPTVKFAAADRIAMLFCELEEDPNNANALEITSSGVNGETGFTSNGLIAASAIPSFGGDRVGNVGYLTSKGANPGSVQNYLSGHVEAQRYNSRQSGAPPTGELSDGECTMYCSDGSDAGSAGDLMYAVNDGGTIKTSIIVQRSNAT